MCSRRHWPQLWIAPRTKHGHPASSRVTPVGEPDSPFEPDERALIAAWRSSGEYDRLVADIVAGDPDLRDPVAPMALVVDDHLLLDLLTETQPAWLASELGHAAVYTTGSWYYRVPLAMHRGTGGTLSSRLAGLEPHRAQTLLDKIGRLPDWIGLIGPRTLIPVMASLVVRRQPTGSLPRPSRLRSSPKAPICVTVDSPLLRAGADDLSVPFRLV